MYFGLLLQWAVLEVRGCAQFIFKQKNSTHSLQPGFWKKSNFSVLIEPRLICEGSNTAFSNFTPQTDNENNIEH
jgi:hypothetical protein